MEKNSYNKLEETENSLKIDRDIIELQKTIIFYGDKIIFKLDTIIDLLEAAFPNRKNKIVSNRFQEPLVQLLQNMKIPKEYKRK